MVDRFKVSGSFSGDPEITFRENVIPQRNVVRQSDPGQPHSHSGGLDRVPYDGYYAKLHKGEQVLSAEERQNYSPREKTYDFSDQPIILDGSSGDPEEIADQFLRIMEERVRLAH